jgi:hypothetical protein
MSSDAKIIKQWASYATQMQTRYSRLFEPEGRSSIEVLCQWDTPQWPARHSPRENDAVSLNFMKTHQHQFSVSSGQSERNLLDLKALEQHCDSKDSDSVILYDLALILWVYIG